MSGRKTSGWIIPRLGKTRPTALDFDLTTLFFRYLQISKIQPLPLGPSLPMRMRNISLHPYCKCPMMNPTQVEH